MSGNAKPPWVIFSDLDGSLLDEETYSFDRAREALEAVRRSGVPLVFCTSKTASETLAVQRRVGVTDPFVVEGGGGVYVPKGYFRNLPRPRMERGDHVLLPLSPFRVAILSGFKALKDLAPDSIRGFSDMSVAEIAADAGLTPEQAARAREREFSEPFRLLRGQPELLVKLRREAHRRGLRLSRGNRYYHLHGEADKGLAVELLLGLFEGKTGPVRSMALGDSEIDLPMLQAVERPVAIRRRHGRYDPSLLAGVRGILKSRGIGPAGWNHAVLQALG